ncbi:hypothetical protein C8R47DRAFT_1067157 [Mycena vitilis]|nr:hypothetical protein C8R47DRAFT_1067157 [Mycena vitilis]
MTPKPRISPKWFPEKIPEYIVDSTMKSKDLATTPSLDMIPSSPSLIPYDPTCIAELDASRDTTSGSSSKRKSRDDEIISETIVSTKRQKTHPALRKESPRKLNKGKLRQFPSVYEIDSTQVSTYTAPRSYNTQPVSQASDSSASGKRGDSCCHLSTHIELPILSVGDGFPADSWRLPTSTIPQVDNIIPETTHVDDGVSVRSPSMVPTEIVEDEDYLESTTPSSNKRKLDEGSDEATESRKRQRKNVDHYIDWISGVGCAAAPSSIHKARQDEHDASSLSSDPVPLSGKEKSLTATTRTDPTIF